MPAGIAMITAALGALCAVSGEVRFLGGYHISICPTINRSFLVNTEDTGRMYILPLTWDEDLIHQSQLKMNMVLFPSSSLWYRHWCLCPHQRNNNGKFAGQRGFLSKGSPSATCNWDSGLILQFLLTYWKSWSCSQRLVEHSKKSFQWHPSGDIWNLPTSFHFHFDLPVITLPRLLWQPPNWSTHFLSLYFPIHSLLNTQSNSLKILIVSNFVFLP